MPDFVLVPCWSQLKKSAVPGLIRDHVRMNVSPDAFFLWFISEVAGPRFAEAAIDQLRPGWESKLAKRAIEACDVRVSKRRVRRWLSSSEVWNRIARSRTDDLVKLVESLEAALRRDRSGVASGGSPARPDLRSHRGRQNASTHPPQR